MVSGILVKTPYQRFGREQCYLKGVDNSIFVVLSFFSAAGEVKLNNLPQSIQCDLTVFD